MNSNRRYSIGSGYFCRTDAQRWFYKIWEDNTFKYASPESVFIVGGGGQLPDSPTLKAKNSIISINGDIGHVGQLLSGEKPYEFSGWSITICILALCAYYNETDFIFKEQDTLCFGAWVDKMYDEIGERNVIFGKNKLMGCAQSIFLVKHQFIPRFVSLYLNTGGERDRNNLGEHKFMGLLNQFPNDFAQFSFGYDRDRPFDVTDSVFYVQKLTASELNELKSAGLVSFDGDPPCGLMTNCE